MTRYLIPALMILVAILGLGAVTYTRIPEYSTSTYSAKSVLTAVNTELVLHYSYSNISCASELSAGCYAQIAPYTTYETWSGETTKTLQVLSTASNYVLYATSGAGEIVLISAVALLALAIVIVVRGRRPGKSY